MRKNSASVWFVVSVCVVALTHAYKNNVCKSFSDYSTMENNVNCFYNPEFDMSLPDIVRRNGYPFEQHEVTTSDGYIITLHRLPKDQPKGVIFFQPPAMSSSIGMVDKGSNDSLGFMLWDAGYDVWLGNFRGNTYGRNHTHLDPDTSTEFWDFSFHEVGLYDVPAQMEYAAKKSGAYPQKITFMGYSMGGTAGIVYGSLLPEHSKKWTKAMVLFGATAVIKHMKMQVVLILARLADVFKRVGEMLNINEIFAHNPNSTLRQLILPCQQSPMMSICVMVELVTSYTTDDIPPLWYPLRFAHNPEGISFHILLHYMQLINAKKFQYFDYGPAKNMIRYNTTIPPEYPVENFAVPILLTTGENDKFSTMEDMEFVYKRFRPEAQKYGVVCQMNCSHDSFYYGTTATENTYKPTIEFLDKLYSNEKIEEEHIHC